MKTLGRIVLLLPCLAPVATAQAPAPQPMDTVRVASRAAPLSAAAQRTVEVLGREAIDRLPARTVTDVLELAVGADVQRRSPAQADLSLRGSALGQVLVLVDGVRMSDLQTGHFDLDLAVPLDAVARIEILRGPGATLYGPDAIGGVVNVVTRRGDAWRRLRLHGGSFGTLGGGIGAAIRAGRTGLRISADGERSSGHRDGTDYETVQAGVAATRDVGVATASLDLGVGARNFGAADFYAPAPSYERTRSQTASVRLATPAESPWHWALTAATRRHSDDFILRRADPAFYRNRHTSWQHTMEVAGRGALRDGVGLAVGAEGFAASLASARLGDRRERRLAAFGEMMLGSAAGANASAGVRVDRSTSLGTFASPSLGISVPAHPRLRLRASAARGLRAPSWTERYYSDPANVADPDLGPERFWSGEAGLHALPRWGMLDVAVFARRAADLIDWVRPADAPSTVPWTTANLERATYRGIEAELRMPDVAGLDVRLAATGLAFHAAAADTVVGKYALRPLTRTFGARVGLPAVAGVRVTVDARNGRRAAERDYTVAGIRAEYRLARLGVHLDVTNLLGASYLDAAARPAAGRAIVLGVNHR